MLTNRIQHLMPEQLKAAAAAPSQGFVPCPVVILATLSADQQFAVIEVYRLAHERTQEALRPAEHPWNGRLKFSLN